MNRVFEIATLYLEMMRAQVHPLRPHDAGEIFHRREFLHGGATLLKLSATVILYHRLFITFLTFKVFYGCNSGYELA